MFATDGWITASTLLLILGIWLLAAAGYRWTVQALERRNLPRWHAWLGWVTLLELIFVSPKQSVRRRKKVTNEEVILPRLDASERSERPVAVQPPDERPI
jgi:hypothetical protein